VAETEADFGFNRFLDWALFFGQYVFNFSAPKIGIERHPSLGEALGMTTTVSSIECNHIPFSALVDITDFS